MALKNMLDLRSQLIQTSVYSFAFGYGVQMIDPYMHPFGVALECIGIVGATYYAYTWSKFNKIFKGLGLGVGTAYPIQKGSYKTEYSTVYKFTLPAGLSLKDFDDRKEAIEQYLGRSIDIKYTYKEIFIEVYKDNIKTMYEYEPIKIKGDMPILIGYDKRGELITCDLSSGEPHMLIAGETGSGKSTTLRSLITNLILMSIVKLHLIDLKMGAEFNVFAKSNRVVSFGRTIHEAQDILSNISKEVDRRYDLFYKKDVKDIKEYNKKFQFKKLDYQVLIIDEFADLQSEKETMRLIEDLGRKARACGIHLILSTQRPDHKVLTGNIKVNVGTVLGLKTLNSTNSNIIIDDTGLEKLRGKGHGLFKRGNITEIQSPFISTDGVKELIKHTYVQKVNDTKTTKVTDTELLEAINKL
jgi:S-DNA-T family DNA segregation ATPase FtsK/SpoIIIE